EVASPVAWDRDPQLVLNFYNMRRKQLYEVEPNAAHVALAELEKDFNVEIITQNVDDLHERAGSTNVLHLHGELKKVRSTLNPSYVVTLDGWELKLGDLCPKGAQLRPHIVWFGEEVPNILTAGTIVKKADLFVVIGTSLQVYPAAGLLHHASHTIPKYLIDPNAEPDRYVMNLTVIREKATVGVGQLIALLKQIS
ncbi:MAG: NAD-dependent deacylase, partial [Bacteroidales bacterium]|nr:NAD-dependent deacylase [Bacteroidales bacterium]